MRQQESFRQFARFIACSAWIIFLGASTAYAGSDTFDGNGALDTNKWTRNAHWQSNTLVRSNHELTDDQNAQYGEYYYTGQSLNGNQYAQFKYVSGIDGPGDINLLIRAAGFEQAGGAHGYLAQFNGWSGQWSIRKFTSPTQDQPLASGSMSLNAGDVIRFEANGTTLRILKNGNQILSTTDSSYNNGVPGIGIYALYHVRIDDWQSGTLGGAPPDTTPPSVPTAISVLEATASSLTVQWNASTDPGGTGVGGYKIYRCIGTSCTPTYLASSAASQYIDNGLAPETAYSYKISAFDQAGPPNESALSSPLASGTTLPAGNGTATDDFNRANGGLGSLWQQSGNWRPLRIESNTLHSEVFADYSEMIYTGQNFADNQYTQIKLVSLNGNAALNLAVRAANYTSNGTTRYYLAQYNGWTQRWSIRKATSPTSDSELALGAANAYPFNAGDTYRFEALTNAGTVALKLFRNSQEILSASDSSNIFAGGKPGIGIYDLYGLVLDDWQGGSIGGGGGDTVPPSVPNTLQVINTTSSTVNFSWSASTDNVGVAGYKVYRNASQVGTTAQTSYNDTGLSSGSTYQYTVAAYDAANNQSSQSSALSATTQSGADNQPPTIPGGLSAYAANAGLISLNWVASTDNVGVASYQLERCTGGGCSNFSAIGTAATNSYNDTSVVPNTAYSYRVKARDAANNWSGYSNVASATTPNAPAAPNPLTGAKSAPFTVALEWGASTGGPQAASYQVEHCVGATCTNWAQIGTTNSGTRTLTHGGASSGATNRYRVRALDGSGNPSAFSSVFAITLYDICQ